MWLGFVLNAFSLFLGVAYGGPVPSDFPPESSQTVVVATTNAYPNEHSEIEVDLNSQSLLTGIAIKEFKGSELIRHSRFSLAQINSAAGALLKVEFTVSLLILKGLSLEPMGGKAELLYRTTNWSESYGKLLLNLGKSDHGIWVARTHEKLAVEKGPLKLRIHVWTGFGFGIDQLDTD